MTNDKLAGWLDRSGMSRGELARRGRHVPLLRLPVKIRD